MIEKIINWKLTRISNNEQFDAQVPGDITIDLFNAGKIVNPYVGMNHVQNRWVAREDFTYSAKFNLSQQQFDTESINIVFEGVDLFSDIYVNETLVGTTKNMFLKYEFDIKPYVNVGENSVKVAMHSTLNYMENIDTRDFFGVFNVQRLFIRKAQCHFGWDWAPDMPGYGIWGDVYLDIGNKCKISDVSYVAHNSGEVTLFSELNYNVRSRVDMHGNEIVGSCTKNANDYLLFMLENKPNSNEYTTKKIQVCGKKNFACFSVDDVQLWWPIGYGEQNMYRYKVELYRNEMLVDTKIGKLAFREVKLVEKPKADNLLGYEFYVNQKKVFVKGSNWVPIECFTGTVKDEKYRALIDKAQMQNINMLRVWGGGIYEKDIFYNLCDEKGILVWQDMMFACGDIPEDDADWVDNATKEIEYQVKRLRNHPSIVYWCGGNEKTGSYGLQISHGDYFVNYVVRGIVNHLDGTRPYAQQSPVSRTDVGNDLTSGESHFNSFERSLSDGILNYRKFICEKTPTFVSECAILGPCSVQSTKKIFPKDKLWPMNEVWVDRLMDNKYAAVIMCFAEREMYYVTTMYGKPTSLDDFVTKGMTVHAEMMRAEVEMARKNKSVTSGILNWMFSDIWPTCTWSIVDYYGEPKQVYYQLKRSYRPTLFSFVENADGTTSLFGVTDINDFDGKITFGVKEFDGTILWSNEQQVSISTNEVFTATVSTEKIDTANCFYFVHYCVDGNKISCVYSPDFWHRAKFESDYTYNINKVSSNKVELTVKANKFVKGLFVSLDNNCNYIYSDNYVDIEAGESVVITITAPNSIDETKISVSDFAKQ